MLMYEELKPEKCRTEVVHVLHLCHTGAKGMQELKVDADILGPYALDMKLLTTSVIYLGLCPADTQAPGMLGA